MLIDAAIQTLTALLQSNGLPFLPARMDRVVLGADPYGGLIARARLRHQDAAGAFGNASLERADGTLVLLLQGVELRPVQAAPGAWFYDLVWRPVVSTGRLPEGRWHAIGPGAATAASSYDETGEAPLPAIDGILDLRPLTTETPVDCITATAALARRAAALSPPPRLLLVSRGASAAPPVCPGTVPAASVLMGVLPVIEAEHPALRPRWVDLDPDDPVIPAALHGPAGRYAMRPAAC